MNVKTPAGECGVIIGRFQTPYLTIAHKEMIETVRAKHPKFVIVLGVARHIPSKINPMDFATRAAMIQETYPGTIVLPINDVREDKDWSVNLDVMLRSIMPTERIILYGGRDSFVGHYKGNHLSVELEEKPQISSTQVRQEAFHNIRGTEDFRRGICYAVANQWPKIIPTVDVAIVRGNRILLGKKPGEKMWRFIGGFAEKNESLESTANREAIEEAGINSVSFERRYYVGSCMIDDWRYAGSPDQIKTTLYALFYPTGPAQAGDDIEHVVWFDIEEDLSQKLMPEHRDLWDMFFKWYKKNDDLFTLIKFDTGMLA